MFLSGFVKFGFKAAVLLFKIMFKITAAIERAYNSGNLENTTLVRVIWHGTKF